MWKGLAALAAMMIWWGSAAWGQTLSVFSEPRPPEVVAKPLGPGSKPRSVSLARVGDSMKQGQPWALIMWGRKCPEDNLATWDSERDSYAKDPLLDRAFRDELTALGFEVAGDPNNLFKEGDDGAELQVGALVTDISIMACAGFTARDRKLELKDAAAVGSAQMAVEWQIYSPVESRILAKIPTETRVDIKDPQTEIVLGMLTKVFAENVRALAATDAFRAAVLSAGPSVSAPRAPKQSPPIVLPQASASPRPLAEVSGSVVVLFTGDGMGSGFLVSRDGHLLTNRHVVGASKYLKVKWSDGIETVGEVVRTDLGRDIALVKTEPRGRQPLPLRRGAVQPGDTVFAIGTPLDKRLQGSLTQGVVSGNRVLDGYRYIQSDVVVNPGNSGGPLLNAKGEVVGVTVSGVGQEKAPRGINFFIPIDDALDFLSLQLSGPAPGR